MHTIEEQSRDTVKIGNKQVSLHGKFRLTCRRDPAKFHLANLSANVPKGKSIESMDHFYGVNGKMAFFLMDRIQKNFKPDESEIDAKNVAVLIRHPDVRLLDMSDAEHEVLVRMELKKANPLFTLINLDKSSIENHADEVEMIEISYLITKKNNLSKKKLMYIASAIGLSTRSEITDEVRYIAHLQSQMIAYLKGNKDKRKVFMHYYEKINEAEMMYFINEFIALGFVQDFSGMYKIGDVPVGFKIPDVKEWFAQNEDEYNKYVFQVQEFHNGKVTS